MKPLAAYSFTASRADDPRGLRASNIVAKVDEWLASKGQLERGGLILALSGHRFGSIERQIISSSLGQATTIVLTEPLADDTANLHTTIAVAESHDEVAVSVRLAATSSALAPLSREVYCPRIVQELLAPPSPWEFNGVPLASAPLNIVGEQGGARFAQLLWEPTRLVPIVAISDQYGEVLHPSIVDDLARDLAGLALVTRLDPAASWQLTRDQGKVWSCFGGAIRLYWPSLTASSSPLSNPLWTTSKLLQGVDDSASAASRIRRQLRRQIFEQSSLAISEPHILLRIRRTAAEEELGRLKTATSSSREYKNMAERYFEAATQAEAELMRLNSHINTLIAENNALREANRYLLQAQLWRPDSSAEVEPDAEVPPETVEEAVLKAMEELDGDLIFGEHVFASITGLASDAGPPEKMLRYLRMLSALAKERRRGPLGTTTLKWLEDRGVTASAESETVRNSPTERRARTWNDGTGGEREFELHLKPSDGTSPDRCVRIYFDIDDTSDHIVIGWVGRHP